ncbi:MAG: reverse transcriptase domain-containing protein, partial [Bdellovibrionia bacterium]
FRYCPELVFLKLSKLLHYIHHRITRERQRYTGASCGNSACGVLRRGSAEKSALSTHLLDIWFSWINDTQFGGSARIVRYADDAVFTFRTLEMAENFRNKLEERLKSFGISLNAEKTKALVCGPRVAAY